MQRWIVPAILAALYPAASRADTIVTTTTTVVTTDSASAPAEADALPPAVDATPQAGATLAIGAMSRALPASVRSGSSDVFPTDYTIDATSAKSLWLAVGVETENVVFMTDMTFGGASISGMTRELPDPPFHSTASAPFAFHGTLLESSLVLRLGARVSHGDLAFAAGAGIGGTLWIIASSDVQRSSTSVFDTPMGPSGPTASWFVPVWAEATYKATSDWGLQLLASSDRASGTGPGTATLGLAAVFQPSTARR